MFFFLLSSSALSFSFFFFNDTATTEIYTLSLHDALPICVDCQEKELVEPSVALFFGTDILSSQHKGIYQLDNWEPSCGGKCPEGSTESTPIIEFCLEGSIKQGFV